MVMGNAAKREAKAMNPSTSQIDFAPLILALAGLITSFGGAIVWYVRSVLTKQSQLFDDALHRNLELSNMLSATQTHNARLAEANRVMRDDIQELRDKFEALQKRFDELQGQRNTERMASEQRALQYQNEIIERDRTIRLLREEITALNKRLDEVNKRLNAMNMDYEAVVSERDKLREGTQKMADEIAALQRENAAVTKHNGELDEKIRKLQADMDMMKAQTAPATPPLAPEDEIGLVELRKAKETLIHPKDNPPGDKSA